jgi:hypothetical protein
MPYEVTEFVWPASFLAAGCVSKSLFARKDIHPCGIMLQRRHSSLLLPSFAVDTDARSSVINGM